MANEQNLIPAQHKLTVDEASKGGKASGQARRKRKQMREALDELLSRDFTDRSGNRIDGTMALMTKTFQKAMDGDLRAIQFIRDTVGEMPVQRIEMDTIDPQARAEMDKLLGLDE